MSEKIEAQPTTGSILTETCPKDYEIPTFTEGTVAVF